MPFLNTNHGWSAMQVTIVVSSHAFPQHQLMWSKRCAGDAIELAAALARQPQTGGAGVVRPPAIVVEYMGQGSLKGAIARKADIVQGPLIRVLIAMDAAKVGFVLHLSPTNHEHSPNSN